MENEYIMPINGEERHFKKNLDDKDKYVVLTCAKNEDEYIKEFVEHYISIGFDKVFIGNNDDDQNIVNDILKEYIDKGCVEIFDCSGLKGFQIPLYDMFLANSNYKWCAYFDCDEFLEINGLYNSIKEFLDEIKEDCVVVNWMMYGSNNEYLKREGRIQDRFTQPIYPLSFKENMFVKSIIRGGIEANFKSPHSPFLRSGNKKYNIGGEIIVDDIDQVSYPIRFQKIWLKHYYCKSFEEWIGKIKRGWPDLNDTKRLYNFEHYKLMSSSSERPLVQYTDSVFSEGKNEWLNDVMHQYDIIGITMGKMQNHYALLHYFAYLCTLNSDITFMLFDKVDESIYLELLEVALRTGNRLIKCNNTEEDISKIYFKFHKRYDNNYYVITAQ